MFLKSAGLAFDQARVHTVGVTLGKNTATQVEEVQALELKTDTWHQTVTDPDEIQQCLKEIDVLGDVKSAK